MDEDQKKSALEAIARKAKEDRLAKLLEMSQIKEPEPMLPPEALQAVGDIIGEPKEGGPLEAGIPSPRAAAAKALFQSISDAKSMKSAPQIKEWQPPKATASQTAPKTSNSGTVEKLFQEAQDARKLEEAKKLSSRGPYRP